MKLIKVAACLLPFMAIFAHAADCLEMATGHWAETSRVQGFFAWSKPTALITARTFRQVDMPVKSRADEERRALLTAELEGQCLGFVQGSSAPEEPAFDPSGDVALERFAFDKGKDLILVKSRLFLSSETEYGALFIIGDGDANRALKMLINKLTYESSPSGREVIYPFKMSLKQVGVLEHYENGLAQKPSLYLFDAKQKRLISL